MMESLCLVDFLSYRNAQISLGRFNLFVGGVGVGKSNLVSALEFWHKCVTRGDKERVKLFDPEWIRKGVGRKLCEGSISVTMQGKEPLKVTMRSLDDLVHEVVVSDFEGSDFLNWWFSSPRQTWRFEFLRVFNALEEKGLLGGVFELMQQIFPTLESIYRDKGEKDCFKAIKVRVRGGGVLTLGRMGSVFRDFYLLCANLLLRKNGGTFILDLSDFYLKGKVLEVLIRLLRDVYASGSQVLLCVSDDVPSELVEFFKGCGGKVHNVFLDESMSGDLFTGDGFSSHVIECG